MLIRQLRDWLLEPLTTKVDALLSSLPAGVDPNDPRFARCPTCGKSYNMAMLVSSRVSQATVECNRCFEHMELSRKVDGSWHVLFRDKSKL